MNAVPKKYSTSPMKSTWMCSWSNVLERAYWVGSDECNTNGQHRGRCGVGIEILICYEERMGCQVYQKGGRGHVVRP